MVVLLSAVKLNWQKWKSRNEKKTTHLLGDIPDTFIILPIIFTGQKVTDVFQ